MKHGKAIVVVALTVCLVFLFVGCSGQSGRRPGGIVYYTEKMSQVKAMSNIAYTETLKMDIYHPPESEHQSKYPAVIVVHGKSNETNLKDNNAFRSWGDLLAASGFTAVVFNWTTPGDIRNLIAHVRENAAEYKIDPENLAVIAFSAGVDAGLREALRMDGTYLKALVGYYGAPPRDVLNTREALPPVLLAVAGLDSEGFIKANDAFYQTGIEMGFNIARLDHPRGSHGFDLFNNDERSKEIILATIDFLRESMY